MCSLDEAYDASPLLSTVLVASSTGPDALVALVGFLCWRAWYTSPYNTGSWNIQTELLLLA